MAKKGRPRIEIKPKIFEGLCSIQCTEEEIAGVFHCSVDTIERFCKREYGKTFAEAYKIYSADGKISLRRLQFTLAEKSPAMAIWLGKQYLGQTEREIQIQAEGQLADLIDGLREPPIMTIDTESGEDDG